MLQALADEYREDTKTCCPTIGDLVVLTRLSRSSVNRAIETLEDDQLIAIDRRNGSCNYYTLHLDGQLTLRPGPRAVGAKVEKRNTGFRLRPRLKSCVRVTQLSDEKLCQGDTAFAVEAEGNRSQPEIGSCVTVTQVPVDPLCTPGSQEERTATAAPRLPFPLALKPPRPKAQIAMLAKDHRDAKLRRRVAGYAVGLLKHPEHGLALIGERIASEAVLYAAVKALCRRKGLTDYGDAARAMSASVWWRNTLTGKAVIAGKAPRPRDRKPR